MSNCHYLNTDLEIESVDDLTPIVDRFGEDVVVLHHGGAMGRRRATFEVAGVSADADTVINRLCMIVEALPEDERTLWNNCSRRTFDIGYECGTQAASLRSEIRPSTVQRVAALGASIVITIYPPSR